MDAPKMPFTIRISDDYYTALLEYHHPDQPYEGDLFQDILAQLKKQGIQYGLKIEALKDALAQALEQKTDLYEFVVAEGDRHINGTDATVTHFVSFEGKNKPIVKDDGTVDFKNLLQDSSVKKGAILAEKTPCSLGADGMTVTGKPIKHRPGKDVVWKVGENVRIDENGLVLYAEDHGIAKLINGRITVSQLIEVDEVGAKTGNIYFGGDVHVKGNVFIGYTIHCDGDLTIDGVVEDCTIKTHGHLNCLKGILGGPQSDIVVDGNLTTKFIENAHIYVKGDIETGEIVNSKVLCDGKIVVKGKKGLIIGGDITSKFMIEANQIGSRLGVITNINLGVDASVIQELKALKESLQELKILEARLKSRIPVLRSNAIMQPEIEIHADVLKQYEDSLMSTQIDIDDKQARLDQLNQALRNVSQGKVKINAIHPDTMIRIGDSKYFVDKSLSACIISKADNQVVAIGIEKDAKPDPNKKS